MSFWSWWSRKPVVGEPIPIEPERRLAFTDADREYIRDALDRFEANGLQIWSKLNRDLIVARALIDADRWKQDGELAENGLLMLFLALAAETDSLTYYVDEMEEQFKPLSSMDDDAAEEMLQEHSDSIFVNARSICTVIEEDTSLNDMVYAFFNLNSLGVSQVSSHVLKNGLTRVSFYVEGLGECRFEIDSGKRPDVTPALAEMNRISKSKALGQYIMVSEGSSESMTFIFAAEAILPKITNLLKIPGFVSPDTPQPLSP
jgi:hypothetical protein